MRARSVVFTDPFTRHLPPGNGAQSTIADELERFIRTSTTRRGASADLRVLLNIQV
jgi:hypothetical protein